jgi:very-short-patch-repair endonuclease
MARRLTIPRALRRCPFTIQEARAAGLTWDNLQSANYRRLPPGIYVAANLPDTPLQRLAAARLRLPPTAVFSGLTAAWLHGLDVSPPDLIQVTLPAGSSVAMRAGVRVRRTGLSARDVVTRQGMPVTSLLRTLLDLGAMLPLIEAVTVADMALHQRLINLDLLLSAVQAGTGSRGAGRQRLMVDHAEPRSESAMESRLRMRLVLGGLPRPLAQVDLHNARGRFLGRADLYYPSHRLVIEYDGSTHRDSLVHDNRRQNQLLAAGYTIFRFTAADVLGAPDRVVAQIRGELARPHRAAAA